MTPQGARVLGSLVEQAPAAFPAPPQARAHAAGLPGWARTYLALAILLVPVVQPAGPSQTAILDFVNVIFMGLFAAHVMMTGRPVRLPFLPAMLLIVTGSLIATLDAESPAQGLLTIAQEVYLYLWFVMVVNLLDDPEEQRRARILWTGAALLAAVTALVMIELQAPGAFARLFGARGIRAAGTFTNPNMLADYVVLSFYMVASSAGQFPRLIRWGAFGFLLLALLSTKSNGGLMMLTIGGVTFLITRILTRRVPPVALLGAVFGIVGVAALGFLLVTSFGHRSETLKELKQKSFLGRASHSSESRAAIWVELVKRYPKHALGIGPGNSKLVKLEIGERQRPDSFMGKTSHNDYVGFLVERGPLGLGGLLALMGMAFWMAISTWRSSTDPEWQAGEGGLVLAALIAILVATSFHSIMIEKLHFRHFWFLLALVAAFRPPTPAMPRISLQRI